MWFTEQSPCSWFWQGASGKRLQGRNIRSRNKCSYAELLLFKVQQKKNPESFHGLWTKLQWLNLIPRFHKCLWQFLKAAFHLLLPGDIHCRLLKLFSKKHLWVSIFFTFQLIQTHTSKILFMVENTIKCNCLSYQLAGVFLMEIPWFIFNSRFNFRIRTHFKNIIANHKN